MKHAQHVFLITTHVFSEEVLKRYQLIRDAASAYGEALLLFHQTGDTMPDGLDGIPHHAFTNAILQELQYKPIAATLVPGSNHFPLLQYYLQHPEHKYYWYIEYDALFTGNWQLFFDELVAAEADLLSTCLELYPKLPHWHYWDTLHHPDHNIPREQRVRSFNPVYRMSAAALGFIHQSLTTGWSGHHEVLLPTLLYHHQFTLLDIGGRGRFTPPGFKDRFYDYRTYRYRPVFREAGPVKNKLYHPVK
ncbi:hypothetical protein [Paraflavitalea pollutisoli]|uniref:hypothetical protein n=1 Tax=Paraflavitalea pollutisoli TaxID=3034143 RepID=UPI0023ED6734|nr:hypothetical protein [Paraflavitalea sp. H1-2-19X]